MSESILFGAPPEEEFKPYLRRSMHFYGYFEDEQFDALLKVGMKWHGGVASETRRLKSDILVPTRPFMARDALSALRSVINRAWFEYKCDDDFLKMKRAENFLPYVDIKFCEFCPPKWAGQRFSLEIKFLKENPQIHCTLPQCTGFSRSIAKAGLKDRPLSELP